MKESDDIANLFRHFGGQPGQYQEISRANEARQSRERWPLLASIEADQAAQRPPVDVAIHQDAPQAQAPQPAIPPVAVQPVAPPPDPEPAPQPAAPHAGRIEPHLSPDLASPPPSGQAAEKPRAAAIVPPRPGGLRDRMRPLAALAALAPEPAAGPEAPAPGRSLNRSRPPRNLNLNLNRNCTPSSPAWPAPRQSPRPTRGTPLSSSD